MSHDIEAIDRALADLVRRPNLPRLHALLAAEAGVEGIERGGLHVMAFIHHNQPTRLSDIAAALGVDQSTISRHVARLEAGGLVDRTPDPADGRVSLLSVSERGLGAHDAIREARKALIAGVVADWSPADRRRLAADLRRLADDFAAYVEGMQ